jgi:hypothetical protein
MTLGERRMLTETYKSRPGCRKEHLNAHHSYKKWQVCIRHQIWREDLLNLLIFESDAA